MCGRHQFWTTLGATWTELNIPWNGSALGFFLLKYVESLAMSNRFVREEEPNAHTILGLRAGGGIVGHLNKGRDKPEGGGLLVGGGEAAPPGAQAKVVIEDSVLLAAIL